VARDPIVPGAVVIRAARTDEATLLSALALQSKGYWGYDEAFLEACRAELTVGVEQIAGGDVQVLERGGVVLGFYLLSPASGEKVATAEAELELFYVDPDAIGVGHGRRLWRHLVRTARRRRYRRIVVHSDPHAEGFYRAMGARRVGDVPSGSIPGRTLPLLCIDIDEGAT
jgi:ribosomal protein S18 acetylase RimI-like enzyme